MRPLIHVDFYGGRKGIKRTCKPWERVENGPERPDEHRVEAGQWPWALSRLATFPLASPRHKSIMRRGAHQHSILIFARHSQSTGVQKMCSTSQPTRRKKRWGGGSTSTSKGPLLLLVLLTGLCGQSTDAFLQVPSHRGSLSRRPASECVAAVTLPRRCVKLNGD